MIAAALVFLLVAGYFLQRQLNRIPKPSPATVPAVHLGLVEKSQFAAGVPSEEAELAALESGEAGRSIDAEIEKAERLISPLPPDSDEHRMLHRRIKMLRALKEKMRK